MMLGWTPSGWVNNSFGWIAFSRRLSHRVSDRGLSAAAVFLDPDGGER